MPAISAADSASLDRCEVAVVGLLPRKGRLRLAPGAEPVDAAFGGRLVAALEAVRAKGRPGEVIRIPTLGLAPFPVVVGVGLGPDGTAAESVRRAVGAAMRGLADYSNVHVAIDADPEAIAEGALLGSYAFTAYKSAPPKPALKRVTVSADAKQARTALTRARIVAEAVNVTRDLVNTPPNDLYPETFAARVAELARARSLEVEVLEPRALARGGYGGLLAVGAGSVRTPRLVRLTYRPARPAAHVALVGKGITFDSGGLNLKKANLTWMKSDMGGAAAAATAAIAAAALRLPVEVTATLPMAENMPSGSAYHPSDVLTMRNGRTVEVADTDAEGRLILGDAITRALEDDPQYLIEVSTLTGAQLTALGTRVIGAMGEPGLRELVASAGNDAGESVWPMPLPEDLRAGLDSPVADLVNVPDDRWGGMLVAGHFLADFMSVDVPWVHLDIAGPAFNAGGPRDYTPKGGTGAGVRTIIASLRRLAAG